MSSQGHDDAFFNFCLGLLAVVGVLAAAVYVFSFLMPIVVFYVMPFALASLLVGYALWFLVQNGEGGFQTLNEWGGEKSYVSGFNFKMLAVAYPFLVLATLVVFGFGSGQTRVIDKKGNVQGVYLEWPKLNSKYNEVRSNWYSDSMFESLREEAKKAAVYDRSDLGFAVWMALILGGPAFFFWLSRDAHKIETVQLNKAVEEKVKERKAQLQSLINDQNEIIKRRQKPLDEEIQKLRARFNEVVSENQVLKAKMEFGKPAQTVKAVEKAKSGESGGVLDGDLL